MPSVSIKEAQDRLPELVSLVEDGQTVVITRDGRPVLDLVRHGSSVGLDLEAGDAFLRARGITDPVPFVSADFDDPLSENLLIAPLV